MNRTGSNLQEPRTPIVHPVTATFVFAVAGGDGMRRAQSISCMTQLQAKAAAATDQDQSSRLTRRCAAAIDALLVMQHAGCLSVFGRSDCCLAPARSEAGACDSCALAGDLSAVHAHYVQASLVLCETVNSNGDGRQNICHKSHDAGPMGQFIVSHIADRMSMDIMGWSPPDSAASLPAWGAASRAGGWQPAGSSPPGSEHSLDAAFPRCGDGLQKDMCLLQSEDSRRQMCMVDSDCQLRRLCHGRNASAARWLAMARERLARQHCARIVPHTLLQQAASLPYILLPSIIRGSVLTHDEGRSCAILQVCTGCCISGCTGHWQSTGDGQLR